MEKEVKFSLVPTFRYTRLLLLKDGYKKITDGFTL